MTMSAKEVKGFLVLFSLYGASDGSLSQLLKEGSNKELVNLSFRFLF